MNKKIRPFLVAMTSVHMLLLCVALFVSSCSSDDCESQTHDKRDTGTWYMCDDDLSSYVSEIRSAYNKNPLAYYNYVAENGEMNRAGNNYGIQIINKNTLKIWYFSYGIMGCDPSLDSEYYLPTNYSIGTDQIISYSTYSSMYTYVESEGKIILTNGDIYTMTAQGLVRDGSSKYLRKKTVNVADFKEEIQTIRDCKNKTNTTLNVVCDYENFLCHITFSSSLTKLHPSKPFVYGFEYGLKNSYLEIYETQNSSLNDNVPIEGYTYYTMSKGSLAALDEKLKNGIELTKNEKDLYVSITKKFEALRSNAKQNFIVKCYIRYGGVKYYID